MPKLLRTALVYLIAALIVGLAGWAVIGLVNGWRTAKVEARLNKNQAGAAIGSGKDAVETVGQRQASDVVIDRKVNDAKSEVAAATDAASADAAGRRGLCGISGDLCRQHPLQQPGTR